MRKLESVEAQSTASGCNTMRARQGNATRKKFAFDVFISYNHSDSEFVDYICEVFDCCKIKYFRDIADFKLYETLSASIKLNISNSRFLVSIVSRPYLNSFWCMFEAIEAIQSQDTDIRFLPIILKNERSEEVITEDFVVKSLNALSDEIQSFEERIALNHAYELSAKLEKLNFVRSKLPHIFNKIQERLYPEFILSGDVKNRDSISKLVEHIKGDKVDRLSLKDFKSPATPKTATLNPITLQSLPSIYWKKKIGKLAKNNSPIAIGNCVYISTSGDEWNEPDSNDAILCLDARTGATIWTAQMSADANRVLYCKGLILTGCDDGTAVAISAADGRRLWSVTLDNGIVGGPQKLPIGQIGDTNDDIICFSTYSGSIYNIELHSGHIISHVKIPGKLLSDFSISDFAVRFSLGCIIAPSINGVIYIIPFNSGGVFMEFLVALDKFEYSYIRNSSKLLRAKYETALESDGPIVYVPYRRETYAEAPPIFAYNIEQRKIIWVSTGNGEEGKHYGNIRGRLIIRNDEIVFCAAYSDSITAISRKNGGFLWDCKIGSGQFEQWSAPISRNSSIYIGRSDGYLHKIELGRQTREWSIYIGRSDIAGTTLTGTQNPPEFLDPYSWRSDLISPILSTPTIDGRILYAGTLDGWLYCIGDLGQ